MKAMILAAGLGTRLRPLTQSTPKPLLPVAGIPLLGWNILLLRRHGLTDIIVNVHYLADQIQQAFGDGSSWGVRLSYSFETTLLGTGGGIKQVEDFFEGKPFVVVNGDTLLDLNLTAMVAHHRARGGIATMALRDDPHVERWGVVETDAQSRVVTILGQGRSPASRHATVYRRMFAGAHVMDPLFLHKVPKGVPSSIIEAYIGWLQQDAGIWGYPFSGYWSDIGTPERYAQVQEDVKAGILRLSWPEGSSNEISISGERPSPTHPE
ncbi:MAG: nucleotidyltransferase family protein [Nitrospirae bacterium]|nr:MAG: nucleotidyltransferase family protein [Nitrospirota bacterium]